MSLNVAEKRARFRAMHQEGLFLLPNPWDVGGVRRLEAMGYRAIASTSAGLAWSLGRKDYQLTLDEVLAHLTELCAATDLPVNADFENGFADDPDGVAANVALAVATGVCGVSIEDSTRTGLYERSLAVERIAAAREAIDRSGADVVLVGRSEGFIAGRPDWAETLARLVAYGQAGADCLYAPGVTDLGCLRELVAAVAPKPVNVLLWGEAMRVADLAAIGVRRVSTGGALAAAAWSGFEAAARMVLEEGRVPPRR